ncbi:MAG: HipA domain-containing protein [bacterium]
MVAIKNTRNAQKIQLDVCIGKEGLPIGELAYVKDGAREYSVFAYNQDWLRHPAHFTVSPDLALMPGHQVRKPPTKDDPRFFLALADTEPDAWGRRVIARAHAKERKKDPTLKALTELDYLCAVDDFSRIGALRLCNDKGDFLRTVEQGVRATAPLLELEHIFKASRAVERSQESAQDLHYLLGKGTSLGGMRPKCTVLDDNGTLALGKFPSVKDERSITRGEVLALRLARLAGIETSNARILIVKDTPIAVITRFDRTHEHGRIAYLSAASLLQVGRNEEHAYTEVVDAMKRVCVEAKADAQQLWRRLAFNHLITNVDDHLQNLGFLYVGNGLWRLAPAFDLNPFPDKDRESKTWLSEDTGPITTIETLLEKASYFHLSEPEAIAVLGEVYAVVTKWRSLAMSVEVGLTAAEVEEFAPAFEHSEMGRVKSLIRDR